MSRPSQPTGLFTESSGNAVIIKWDANPETDIKGYNIYNATTSGGGVSGYAKLNNELITVVNSVVQKVIDSTTTVQVIGGVKTTTTVEDFQNISIYAYTHSGLVDNRRQYYVITAVNNGNEESLFSIEISDVPIIITSSIVDFPVRSTSDVAQTMIGRMLDRYPDLDVKPGTMTRDIHIDPHAANYGDLYIYIDFLLRSQSFLTLLNIDDPNNTGSSISVSNSVYKQQLKAALHLTVDADVQSLIDFSFDKLAANSQTFREPATGSIGEVVFYTIIKPTATITVPLNTIVSTTATSTVPAINFQTLAEAKMLISSIDQYFNEATQRYEVTAPVQSVQTGSITNVDAGTITNSTFTQFQVTNIRPTQEGSDSESNSNLAFRAMLAFTGLDIGTLDGYLRTTIGVQYVQDVLVVDAGHPLMQRDYDIVRKQHAYGKVDIYFKGFSEISYTDTFGFVYNGVIDETVVVVVASLPVQWRIQVINPDVSIDDPVYLIQMIENITKSKLYDLTGNFTIKRNAVILPKDQYSMDLITGEMTFDTPLSFGDQIVADYDYKVAITNETVIVLDPQTIQTINNPVALFSEIIYGSRTNNFVVGNLTTSNTIVSISTGLQTVITNDLNLMFSVDEVIELKYDDTHKMQGAVTSYDVMTGILVVNVTSTAGSGSFNPWTISTVGFPVSVITITTGERHIFRTGDKVLVSSPSGILPAPLVADIGYYVICSRLTETGTRQLKLATTIENALAGVAIGFVDAGFGSLVITPDTKVTLVKDLDYTIDYSTGIVTINSALTTQRFYNTFIAVGDMLTADYKYVTTVLNEVVIASASGGEITALLSHDNVVEAILIEADGKTININTHNAINSTIGLLSTDIVRMTYRYRKSPPIIFSNQPVDTIVSIVTANGTVLQEGSGYTFNKVDDILIEGNSVRSQRSVTLLYNPSTGMPEGQLYDFSENVVLAGLDYKSLNKKGIDEHTIVVTDLTQTITYELNNDYLILSAETPFNYVQIARSNTSSISTGQTVIVSYKYGEQMTATYTVNSLIKTIQDKINVSRHVTADVLVKAANQIDVDLEFNVKLATGANTPVVKDQLSTKLFTIFDQKKMGDRISQSDVVAVIDDSADVDYVSLPMTTMKISDGVHIANEVIPNSINWFIYQVGNAIVYKTLAGILRYKTLGSSSDISKFWRVTKDNVDLTLVATPDDVKTFANQAYISSDGSIYLSVNYQQEVVAATDINIVNNTILVSQVWETGTKVQFISTGSLPDPLLPLTDYYVIFLNNIYIRIASSLANAQSGIAIPFINQGTGNHTIVSQISSSVTNFNVTVAYNVHGESGANDIIVSDLDYLNLKSLIINII